MLSLRIAAAGCLLFVFASASRLAAEETWTPLFNGQDLSGWVNVNCAPGTWTVGDGVIRCTGKPIGALRTKRMYENFIVELEWRHLKSGGNAGIFVWGSPIAAPGVPFLRSVEVQVLDNGYAAKGKNEWYTTHGDVFPIHGSRMKPIHKGNGMRCFPLEEHSRSAPEWNHYRIEARDGTIRLSVNGHLVSGGDDCVWRKGYFGLESEGSPTEWRNLRIQELPGHAANAEETAPEDRGWRNLYTGVDLSGWKVTDENRATWKVDDWQLRAAGERTALWSDFQGGDIELVVDCRVGEGAATEQKPAVLLRRGTTEQAIPLEGKAGSWKRRTIRVQGGKISLADGEETPSPTGAALPETGPLSIGLAGGNASFANISVRTIAAE